MVRGAGPPLAPVGLAGGAPRRGVQRRWLRGPLLNAQQPNAPLLRPGS